MKLAAGAVVNTLSVLLERSSGGTQDSRTAGQIRMVAQTVALVVKVRQIAVNAGSASSFFYLLTIMGCVQSSVMHLTHDNISVASECLLALAEIFEQPLQPLCRSSVAS